VTKQDDVSQHSRRGQAAFGSSQYERQSELKDAAAVRDMQDSA
jgi:hypothetical protein